MTSLEINIGPLAALLDQIIPDQPTRDAAKLRLLDLQGDPALDRLQVATEASASDPWTSRARPTFLYVMYVMLLWSIPMGLIAAIRPAVAHDIAGGMTAYLAGIPEPLYALFGTGYLGYTVARSWGKRKGVES